MAHKKTSEEADKGLFLDQGGGYEGLHLLIYTFVLCDFSALVFFRHFSQYRESTGSTEYRIILGFKHPTFYSVLSF